MKNIVKFFLLLLPAILISSCGNDGKEYLLEYKLAEGEIHNQKTVTDMKINQSFMGQKMVVSTLMSMNTTFEVIEATDDKYTLDVKYTEIKADMDMGSGMPKISLDSNTADEVASPDNLSPIFKAATGVPFTVVINRQGEAVSFDGTDKLIESMTAAFDPLIGEDVKARIFKQFEQQFGEESFKSNFKRSMEYFPSHPVKTGDSWDISIDIKTQIDMKIDMKYTLKSVTDNVAVITGQGVVTATTDDFTDAGNGIGTKTTLNGTQTATITVNMNNGMLTKSEFVMNAMGETEVEAGGQNMKIPQTWEVNITVTGI